MYYAVHANCHETFVYKRRKNKLTRKSRLKLN